MIHRRRFFEKSAHPPWTEDNLLSTQVGFIRIILCSQLPPKGGRSAYP